MDEGQEATGRVEGKGKSNDRKRPISPTAETLTEAPQPKKLNQNCKDYDSKGDREIAALLASLKTNENPDEPLRKYL